MFLHTKRAHRGFILTVKAAFSWSPEDAPPVALASLNDSTKTESTWEDGGITCDRWAPFPGNGFCFYMR